MEGVYICILLLLAAARMVGVGEFEQFDGRAVFDYERDADAVGWAVGRNQDFAASKLGGEISQFKRDAISRGARIGTPNGSILRKAASKHRYQGGDYRSILTEGISAH